MLVPLLLWMEYTYVIIFPAIALTAVYFLDYSMKVWIALLAFSVLFFLWQRYVMLLGFPPSMRVCRESVPF